MINQQQLDQDRLTQQSLGLPITEENFPNYKGGGNRNDINKIKRMFADGMKYEAICHELMIVETCVKSFAPKRKRRTPEEMEADKLENEG